MLSTCRITAEAVENPEGVIALSNENKRRPAKRKRKKNKQNVIIFVLAAAIIAVALFTVITAARLGRGERAETTTKATVTAAQTTGETAESRSEEQDSKAGEQQMTQASIENNVTSGSETTAETTSQPKKSESGRIIVDPEKVSWNLLVVSLTREIPEGYSPEVVEVVNSGHDLDKRVAPYYEEMYYAAKKEGIILTPFSGNRSYERQRINYNNLTETYMAQYGLDRAEAQKKAATVILPPGTSEHNIGLAMDICNVYDSFADSDEYAWLMENAYKYGFILRYPKGKEDVTGIVFEPWHWRYVGVEYAKKIRDSGLCLEEYLDSVGIEY